MGKRIVVLGSNSFAGCDFIDLLLDDPGQYEILGISRSPEKARSFLPYSGRPELRRFRFRQLDLNSDFDELMDLVDDFEPSFIVNFAAQGEAFPSWSYPQDFFQTNAVAFARLVDRLVRARYLERFLHISTAGVYGTTPGPLTEATALNPTSPYAVSKAASDFLVLAYFKHRNLPGQIVRATNLYGPYQQLFRIIPKAIILLKQGRRVELHGGGRVIRSFIHIRDASRGQLAVLLRGEIGSVYNLSPDEAYPVREIVEKVCDELGADFFSSTVDVPEREGQEPNVGVDSTKARRQLGWFPQVRLRAGIHEVHEWIEREWDALVSEPKEYVHKR